MEIKTNNMYCIGMMGDKVLVAKGKALMTPDEAINLAAWLITVAECLDQGKSDLDAKLKYILSVIKNPNVEGVKAERKQ